jgi:lysozyme
MKISDNGVAFIRQEEGECLKAYADSRGVLTIGVGHTGLVDGSAITADMHITIEQSATLLRYDLYEVERAINSHVVVGLNQHQYDALCCLVFNIGINGFTHSMLLKKLNASDYSAAADAMLMWCRAGSDPQRLLPRRQRERNLFINGFVF